MGDGMDRRKLLKSGTVLGAGVLLGGVAKAAAECRPTAAQTEGPFYPVTAQRDTDADLTKVQGRAEAAEGTVVVVRGRILNLACQPVAGALVEIWQACATGKYNHPRDPNPARKDPNFQYWGRVTTGVSGEYSFKTIIPGAYPATETWIRPPHIHFKVSAPNVRTFTTQLYFAGQELNASDEILQSLTPAQQRNVIVDFQPAANTGVLTGTFDITLNIDGSHDATPELD